MQTNFNLNELNHFTGSEYVFQHWCNNRLVYTEGIQHLANKLKCYWLIEEMAYVILPKLLEHHFDHFYCIKFFVNNDFSATILIDDGNGNIHFDYEIRWTDFPIIGKEIKFYLCNSGNHYCLMLPSEY